MKSRQIASGSLLALVLTCGLFPKQTLADDGSKEKPVRLYASEAYSPIGVAYSLSTFLVDGRRVVGEQGIWGGELIRGATDSGVNVRMDSVGRILLKPSAVARLAATRTTFDDRQHPLLVASLLVGDISVRLDPDAAAYIESCESAVTSSLGASFNIRIRDGRAIVDVATGTVSVEPQTPSLRFKGRSVQVAAGASSLLTAARTVAIPPGGDTVDTNTKSRKRIVVFWAKSTPQTSSLTKAFSPQYVGFQIPSPQKDSPAAAPNTTPQLEVPAALRRVHFEVEPAIGTITPADTVTDANGFVSVDFVAGPDPGTGTIKGTIVRESFDPPDTVYEPYTRPVIIRKIPLIKTKKVMLSAAAATIVIITTPWPKGPIKQEPPPVIQP
ncbi:MAG TPA: hypothetical protein VFB82_20660 [Blastocatellia bacterium]|nr:hypothetical protein [Blastocatellia bacterium]